MQTAMDHDRYRIQPGEDLEKNQVDTGGSNDDEDKRPILVLVDDGGAVPGESFEYGNGLYAKAQRFAGRFKIEQRGIERVPLAERNDTSYLNVGSMV